MRLTHRLALLSSATIGLALLAPIPTQAAPAPDPDLVRSPTGASTHKVTLITGDVVTVKVTEQGESVVGVERAPGSSTGVATYTVGKSLYVVPGAAQGLIGANRLDDELFNVTKLIESGYADGGQVPLIATYAGAASAPGAAPAGAVKTADLESINATAIEARKGKAAVLWDSITPDNVAESANPKLVGGIKKVWLDGQVQANLDQSTVQIGAPEAWAAGYDGTGVTVGVLDSGIDATHPDFEGKIVETQSFVPDQDASDPFGHGTHVASTVLGSGAASGGLYKGVAPGAKLVDARVLDANGYGQNSWIIAGMEWIAGRADVVNMSLGDPQLNDGTDPMAQALTRLTDETGTLFVVAGGNTGIPGSIGSPGTSDAALTVAAVDGTDVRAYFSSMGPRLGDNGLKPDIAAPGVDITAARSQTAFGEGMYVDNSGTSMASPHVAGAAALILQKHPDWNAQQVKDALVSSSAMLAGTNAFEVGSGRLDVPDALDDLRATAVVQLGHYKFPHDGDEPVVKTITYTNTGSTDIDLTLDETLEGDDRVPVDGLVTLSAASITVPASGSVEVTVTADIDDFTAAGNYTGHVVATDAGGAVLAHTTIGISREPERYDLNLSLLDRSGAPTQGSVVLYRYGDAWVSTVNTDANGQLATQRLDPGIYAINSWLPLTNTSGPDTGGVALLGDPHFVVGKDSSLVLDARTANPVTVTTEKTSENRYRRMAWYHDAGIGGFYSTFAAVYTPTGAQDDMYAAPVGPVAGGLYDFAVRWRRSAPLFKLTADGRPFTPIYQSGSVRLDGNVNLAGVWAGAGTPEDYVGLDVAGKAAFVRRTDELPFYLRTAAAQQAGAAALVIINDRPGKLDEVAFGRIPVLSITKAQGDRLMAALQSGNLRITGTAIESSPFMYDLTKSYPGAIPSNLAWAPRQSDLAQIDLRFFGSPEILSQENRYDCRDYQFPPCLMANYEPQHGSTTRIDYVSTETTNRWYQDVTDSEGWEQRHRQASYQPGEHTSLDYFDPVTRPRLGESFFAPFRNRDFMGVNVPPASSNDLTGTFYSNVAIESRLYQNGVQVGTAQPYQAWQGMVPPTSGAANYRFEMDTVRGAPWTTSTETRSVWKFKSAGTTSNVVLPLLQLDFDIDTALDGTANAKKGSTFGLRASHETGVPGTGTVLGASLAISYDDGATWESVPLKRQGAGWTVKLKYPKRGVGFVSIRAAAWDSAGNEVTQEIIRAWGLR